MRSTQQFSVTLPHKMASQVRDKVASGEYASESEVIREGLRALHARDKAVDLWLQAQVVPAYGALKADETRGFSLEDVRAALLERHARTARTPST